MRASIIVFWIMLSTQGAPSKVSSAFVIDPMTLDPTSLTQNKNICFNVQDYTHEILVMKPSNSPCELQV